MRHRKHIIFFANNGPFVQPYVRENLDLLLMLASFDVSVTIIFIEAGVLQLLDTTPEQIKARAFSSVLKSLPHYEITKLYALDSDLNKYNIDKEQSIVPVEIIDANDLKQLCQTADYIF